MPEEKGNKFPVLLLVVFILGAVIGFGAGFLGQRWQGTFKPKTESKKDDVTSLFASQNGVITGKILGVNGQKIKVQNQYKAEGEVDAGDSIFITGFSKEPFVATSAAELNKLDLSKNVTLNLQWIKDGFKVITIQNLPDLPPLPKPEKLPSAPK